MIFRGVKMRESWLQDYQDKIFKEIKIAGNASCSQNLKTALEFATRSTKEDHLNVLFVIVCQNYYGPKGIRMNNEAYTKFPREREILLTNGCAVCVLEVEKNVKINNTYSNFSDFDGKTI